MTISGWVEILAFCALLIVLAPLLGQLHGEGLHAASACS